MSCFSGSKLKGNWDLPKRLQSFSSQFNDCSVLYTPFFLYFVIFPMIQVKSTALAESGFVSQPKSGKRHRTICCECGRVVERWSAVLEPRLPNQRGEDLSLFLQDSFDFTTFTPVLSHQNLTGSSTKSNAPFWRLWSKFSRIGGQWRGLKPQGKSVMLSIVCSPDLV